MVIRFQRAARYFDEIPRILAAVVLGTILSVGLAACGGGGTGGAVEADGHAHGENETDEPHAGEGGEEGHEHDEASDEVSLTPAAMKDAGVVVEAVTKQPISTVVTAPGRVTPTQDGMAHVGTVVAGRVTRLHVSEGASVGRGTPLVEIEAVDIGDLQGEYLRARAEAEQRGTALARQERLAGEGIGAQRSLEEARSAHEQAAAARRAAETRLRAAGIDPARVGMGAFSSRIVLRSPIAGVVARRNVALGEFLEPARDAFEIVNTSTVWVDAQVSPHAAAGLSVGGVGFVREGESRRAGRIVFISPTVDPGSRTVTVRVEVSNEGLGLRSETFVDVEFEGSVSGHALAVPKEAIEREGSRRFIYREHEPNTFRRVEVEPGAEGGERIAIRSGLNEGDRIAVKGLFYLRSARRKGELQEHKH